MADRPRLLLLQLLGQLRCVQETLGILKELLQGLLSGLQLGFKPPKPRLAAASTLTRVVLPSRLVLLPSTNLANLGPLGKGQFEVSFELPFSRTWGPLTLVACLWVGSGLLRDDQN